jgi:hypothetical protein
MQILIRRGNNAHIGFFIAGRAQGMKNLILEHAQQADLKRRADFTDLVEKKLPPFATAKSPLVALRVGKRAFLYPKSSDSRSVSGSAAQLTATNGCVRRGLKS